MIRLCHIYIIIIMPLHQFPLPVLSHPHPVQAVAPPLVLLHPLQPSWYLTAASDHCFPCPEFSLLHCAQPAVQWLLPGRQCQCHHSHVPGRHALCLAIPHASSHHRRILPGKVGVTLVALQQKHAPTFGWGSVCYATCIQKFCKLYVQQSPTLIVIWHIVYTWAYTVPCGACEQMSCRRFNPIASASVLSRVVTMTPKGSSDCPAGLYSHNAWASCGLGHCSRTFM